MEILQATQMVLTGMCMAVTKPQQTIKINMMGMYSIPNSMNTILGDMPDTMDHGVTVIYYSVVLI